MSVRANPYNCECGGLRHICDQYGHLPDALPHYKRHQPSSTVHVVWSGIGELLDDRQERADDRLAAMPTYDLDDGEVVDEQEHRRYNLTRRHIGRFSRTDPTAPQYKPTIRATAPEASEEQLNV